MLTNIRKNISRFYDETDFSPRPGLKEAVTILSAWSVPAFIFVLFVQWLSKCRSVEYFSQAITEGIGPHLWNVIGVFGFSLFGAALLLPSVPILAFAANRVLVNVYAIGSLMFGLLLGQFLVGLSASALETWRLWLFGALTVVLFVAVLALNLFTWYLSFLIYDPKGKTSFVTNVEKLGIWWRLCISILVMLVPLYLMFAER